ncbi:LysM peptidoglycan-binding domain-containing protein [Rufibacter ruber]|uniref:LysM peptidoglycan-binding domain-containing protein n=1 Tax=Rufibacter ruber TaxID=1783499 RepID=UPI000A4BF20B|nr:LysM peptidoglycan-binding domain-containing protein [Rufibacter ruber]
MKKFVFGLGVCLALGGTASAGTMAVRDSVGVKTQNGKTYITHKVEPNETLYALSRKYGVAVDKIVAANKNIEKSIMVGQIVLIPVAGAKAATSTAATPAKPSPATTASPAASRTYAVDGKGNKMHAVKAGQTLFSISRLHEVTVEDIKKWNKLTSNNVVVGQNLVVGVGANTASGKADIYVPEKDDAVVAAKTPEAPAASTPPANSAPVTATTAKPSPKAEPEEEKTIARTTEYVSRINESGMAEQIDTRSDANKFLALHKTAPVGTIMAVKNPMNDQTVYVRVIGKLPATGDNDKLVLKLSKKACQQIGAVDKRFRVEVSYMP